MKAPKHAIIVIITLTILVSTIQFLTAQASTQTTTITKPSIPEFTLELVDYSHDVPTTYMIDPYTGENYTHPGYHVELKNMAIKIKNQPFEPYYDNNLDRNIHFYYNIRFKGHFSEDWNPFYNFGEYPGYPLQDSVSEYTFLAFLSEDGTTIETGNGIISFSLGAQVEFQVEAMIGFTNRNASNFLLPWTFIGETSGWSETMSITVPLSTSPTSSPSTSPTLSPSSYPTPTGGPELFPITIVVASIAIVTVGGVGILVYYKKYRK